MAAPDIDIRPGDEVEFELRRSSDGSTEPFPRWDGERDRNGSSVWCRGIAERWTDDGDLECTYENPENGRLEQWVWPSSGFAKGRAGWIRPVNRVWRRPVCECGSEKVYGSGPHSHWCPKYFSTQLPA